MQLWWMISVHGHLPEIGFFGVPYTQHIGRGDWRPQKVSFSGYIVHYVYYNAEEVGGRIVKLCYDGFYVIYALTNYLPNCLSSNIKKLKELEEC